MWRSLLARLAEPSTHSALSSLGTLTAVLVTVFPENPVIRIAGDVVASASDVAAQGGGGEALIGAAIVAAVTGIAGILMPERRGAAGDEPPRAYASPIEPDPMRD